MRNICRQLNNFYSIIFLALFLASCQKSPLGGVPPIKGTPVIVILGSSTASGVGANPIDSSWANIVRSTTNASVTKAKFINLAFPNYTTYDVMPNGFNYPGRQAPDTGRNISKALSFKPALVMINLPNNDIAFNYSDQEIMNNYQRLTSMLDSARVQYIVFGSQPRNFSDANQRTRLSTINNKLISRYPGNINDILNPLSNPDFSIKAIYSEGDGIHLNNAGHRVIANATLKHPVFTKVIQ
jgi:acyl-CoA thioesterase-1